MATFIISNVPSMCSRDDLVQHFSNEAFGGSSIKYLLFPLGKEGTRALISFNDSNVASTLPSKKQFLFNTVMRVRPAPRETYQKCTAELDPIIVASIPDLYKCIELLKNEYGIETEFNDETGSLTLIGSLLQIQTAQNKLEEIFQEQQELQRRELIEIGQASLSTPRSSMQDLFAYTRESGQGDRAEKGTQDHRTENENDRREPVSQSSHGPAREDRYRDPMVGHLSHSEENERLGQSLPAMHIDTAGPTRGEFIYEGRSETADDLLQRERGRLIDPSSENSKAFMNSSEHRCIEAREDPVTAKELSSTRTRKTSLERSTERINNLGQRSPQTEFPSTTYSRTVDDIFERNKTRSVKSQSAREFESSDQLSQSLPYAGLQGTYQTRDLRSSSLPQYRPSYALYGSESDREGAEAGGQLRRTYNVDTRQWEYQSTGLGINTERLSGRLDRATNMGNSYDEEYHSLPATLAHSDSSRAAAHGFGTYDYTDVYTSRTTRSVDEYDVTNRSRSSAKIPPSGIEETAELDANVVGYLQKIHPRKVREIEIFHAVNIFYESQDEITTVHLSPKEEYEGVHIQLQKAKEEFINFYQTVFYSVLKESIVFDAEKCTQANHKAITDAVKTAFATTLYLKDDSPGEIMLVGAYEHVSAASDWIKQKLGLRRPYIGEDVKQDEEDSSTIPKLRGVRSEYLMDPETGKPKLALVMHSQKSSKDGKNKDKSIAKSLDERNLEQNKGRAMKETRSSRSREKTKLSATGPSKSSTAHRSKELSKSAEIGKQRLTVAEKLQSTKAPTHKISANKAGARGVERDVHADTMKSARRQPKASLVFRFTTKEGLTVSVFADDISRRQVDVIVNAANEYLKNIGGIAAAISDVGGPQFQYNCTAYVAKNGQLKVSEAVATEATGDLVCKNVIHSVGPMWCLYTNKNKCAAVLQKTFSNALTYANTILGARSIAVPAISTGVYDVPLDVCARSLFNAIHVYSQELSPSDTLRDIQIVNNSEEVSQVLATIFQQLLEVGYQDHGYDSDVSSLALEEAEEDEELQASRLAKQHRAIEDEIQKMDHPVADNDFERAADAEHDPSIHLQSTTLSPEVVEMIRRGTPGPSQDSPRSGQATPRSSHTIPRAELASSRGPAPRSEGASQRSSGPIREPTQATPRSGERTPRLGQASLRSGQGTPRSGKDSPRPGHTTPRSGQASPRSRQATPRSVEATSGLGQATPKTGPATARSERASPHSRQPTSRSGQATPRSGQSTPRSEHDTPVLLGEPIETQKHFDLREDNIPPREHTDGFEAASLATNPKTLLSPRDSEDQLSLTARDPHLPLGNRDDDALDAMFRSEPAHMETVIRDANQGMRHSDTLDQEHSPMNKGKRVGSQFTPRVGRDSNVVPQQSRGKPSSSRSTRPASRPKSVSDSAQRWMHAECDRKIQLDGEELPGAIVMTFTLSKGDDIILREEAFLPNSTEARAIQKLIKAAFEEGKVWCFTEEGAIQNNITLKTFTEGGPEKHGYPDPEYLDRVRSELSKLGFSNEDMGAGVQWRTVPLHTLSKNAC